MYLPYASGSPSTIRLSEATDAYRKSGREDRAPRMMQQLTFNAVVESRFKDVVLLLVVGFRNSKCLQLKR